MENLIYLIPIIASIFTLVLFRKRFVWWESLIVVGVSCLITLITNLICLSTNTDDIEYLGDYVVDVRYYEPWNEWVHRRCTRQVPCGRDSNGNTRYRTETYDCSYCRHHSAKWEMNTKLNYSYNISKNDYNRIVRQWDSPNVFVDMHRRYYTKDGDMYKSVWDRNPKSIINITHDKSYKNKVIASKSVFNFEKISEKEKEEWSLYDYPQITYQPNDKLSDRQWGKTYQDCLIGYDNKEFSEKLNYINSIYGSTKHIRTYILVFNNKSREVAFKQQSYWCNGNFNEHIICLGLNGNIIEWVETFSWEDVPYLSVETKQYFIGNNDITKLNDFFVWYEKKLNEKEKWVCKDASDFDYLKVEMTNEQLIISLVLTLISVIGISIWAYFNDIREY
jgi:hypothetical protein